MKKIFSARQKAAVALEAIKGMKTSNQLAGEYEAHPIQIGMWKKRLMEYAHELFKDERKKNENDAQLELIDKLYKVIGQRDIEIEWLKKKLRLEP